MALADRATAIPSSDLRRSVRGAGHQRLRRVLSGHRRGTIPRLPLAGDDNPRPWRTLDPPLDHRPRWRHARAARPRRTLPLPVGEAPDPGAGERNPANRLPPHRPLTVPAALSLVGASSLRGAPGDARAAAGWGPSPGRLVEARSPRSLRHRASLAAGATHRW